MNLKYVLSQENSFEVICCSLQAVWPSYFLYTFEILTRVRCIDFNEPQ